MTWEKSRDGEERSPLHDPRFEELTELAAIDALEPEELSAFGRHLAGGCGLCRRDLDDWRGVAADLALAAPAAMPPRRLREMLLARVGHLQ